MHILLYKNRFCYITNINKAGHAFGCLTCGKLWKKEYMMHRHEKTCTGDKIKHIYPGGVYQPAPTASELLEANGISVDTHYIFLTEPPLTLKCFFETENLPQLKTPHPRTTYTAKHIPLSVSICSNVPSYQKPTCFISKGSPQHLVDRMIDYLENISDDAYHLMREEFQDVFDQLQEIEKEEEEKTEEPKSHAYTTHTTGHSAQQRREKPEAHLHELPVLGFNSVKYDMDVIKPYFFQHFMQSILQEKKIRGRKI